MAKDKKENITDMNSVINQVEHGVFSNIYYIHGTDVNMVEYATKRIIRCAVGENEDFALTKLDGGKLNLSHFADIVQMFPMITDYNCILINDYNCEKPLEDMRGHTADSINKQLFAILKEIPERTIVIFNVTGFTPKYRRDYRTGKNILNDGNKKLADFALKNGICLQLDIPNERELARYIVDRVSRNGCSVSLSDAVEIVNMCLSDTVAIENEIEKLCAYADGGQITREDIISLVSRQSNVTAYNLANAVVAMDSRTAFNAVRELNIDNNNKAVVFATLAGSFLDLYRASCAIKANVSPEDVSKDFNYGARSFVVSKAFGNCQRADIKVLRKCISIMRDTAVKLNSSAEPRTVLEKAVAEMIVIRRR